MIPIYFPFTYISATVLTGLQTCFKSMIVYQPSSLNIPEKLKKLKQSGWIDLRVPLKSEEEKLGKILKDYKNWAMIHQGEKVKFCKACGAEVPFFDEFSVSQIKADIKKVGKIKASDSVFNARIFLQIAQDLDYQHDELNEKFVLLTKNEQLLYRSIIGEDDAHTHINSGTKMTGRINDKSDYMAFERLSAWTYLFLYDRLKSNNEGRCFFLTTSQAVLEILLENSARARKVISLRGIPTQEKDIQKVKLRQQNLSMILRRLAENGLTEPKNEHGMIDEDEGDDKKAALTIYLIPDETPIQFFQRVAGLILPDGEKTNQKPRAGNILVGMFEIL